MNKIYDYASPTLEILLKKSLDFQKSYERSLILNSNYFADNFGKYDFIAAFGVEKEIEGFDKKALDSLSKDNWLFGHLNFNLKNTFFGLEKSKDDKFNFSDSSFFVPKVVLCLKRGEANFSIYGDRLEAEKLLKSIKSNKVETDFDLEQKFELIAKLEKEEYISQVEKLKEEIQYGNTYEINFCQEFFDSKADIYPEITFFQLNQKFPVPFSSFYKYKEEYLLSFSPERYFCKRSDSIFSQPIKGTARRGVDAKEDEKIKLKLKEDLKEQTENVMIVDLVRNDLSQTAQRDTVKVEELYGLYSFPNVHQLISTISSKLKKEASIWDLIETSFPMGSMTGVPKHMALQLIDKLEAMNREIYSGSVGYIDPDGDADFNVIIRSLVYSLKEKYLSLIVGGAITDLANPEMEYEECLLKAKSFLKNKKQ